MGRMKPYQTVKNNPCNWEIPAAGASDSITTDQERLFLYLIVFKVLDELLRKLRDILAVAAVAHRIMSCGTAVFSNNEIHILPDTRTVYDLGY